MSGKDRIMEILGGEDMLRLMVDAKRFYYPDDYSVGFFVGDRRVYIEEYKYFSKPDIFYYSIQITKRYGGDVLNEHMIAYNASLIKDLLESCLKLFISF